MRKNLGSKVGVTMTTLILLFITVFTFAQDVVVLKHTNYTSHFSKSKKYPVMVEWWITKAKIGCSTPLARKDNFKPDPKLPSETNLLQDYKGSGTDRGHMMPAAENLCQTPAIQDECFYFSNMAAQYHSLNAGDWKSVETMERELSKQQDSVKVWCGNIGVAKRIGRVAVPTKCWKVIYIVKTKEWMAFLFDNNTSKPDGIHNNQVDKIDIEKLTGFKFKYVK
jgi:endonuclease G, mitochondrial